MPTKVTFKIISKNSMMNEADSVHVTQIFEICDLTLEGLAITAEDVSDMLLEKSLHEKDLNLLKEIIDIHNKLTIKEKDANYYSLAESTEFCLNSLNDFMKNSAWWQWTTRKKAANYIEDIQQLNLLITKGVELLSDKYKSELV